MCLLSPASPVGTLGQIGLSLITEGVIEMTLITKQQVGFVCVCFKWTNWVTFCYSSLGNPIRLPASCRNVKCISQCQFWLGPPNRGTTQCCAEMKTSVLAGASSASVSGIICLQTQSGFTWFWLYVFCDGFLLRWTQCSLAKRSQVFEPSGCVFVPCCSSHLRPFHTTGV